MGRRRADLGQRAVVMGRRRRDAICRRFRAVPRGVRGSPARVLGSVVVSPSSARVQLRRHHRAGVQIHRVLGLVGQVRGAVLHLGDLGLGVAPGNPVLVRELLALALAVQTRQVLSRGCLDTALPGPSAPASPGNPRPCPSARCCAAPRWPPWSRPICWSTWAASTPSRSRKTGHDIRASLR